MFDKEKFEVALTKAIDESATPNDVAAAMQNIMQRAMGQGEFGQFGPMDAVFLQQAMQKAQMQIIQKAQVAQGVPAAQAELIRQAQEKQQQETEAAARKAAEQVLAGKATSVINPDDLEKAMQSHNAQVEEFTAKAKEQQAAQMAALKGFNPFGGNASMEMHGRDDAMKAAAAMFQQRQQAMERASAPPVAGSKSVTFSNGDSYTGEYLGNKLHGKGTYNYANGDRYEGEFKDGHKHGKGVMYYANGDRYEGEYNNGHCEGQAKFFFADGRRYEGEYKKSEQTGNGVLYFPNGDRYEGVFKKGYTQSGTLYDKDGNVKKVGIWVPPGYVRPCMRGTTRGQEAAFSTDIVEFEKITGGPILKWVDDNHVEFGSYPQTANEEVQKILWRVLEKKDGKLLLLSEKIIEYRVWDDTKFENRKRIPAPQNQKDWTQEDLEKGVLPWQDCSLRRYLNGEFFEKAFTDTEKKQIVERLNTGNGAYMHKDYIPKKHDPKVNSNQIEDDTYAKYDQRACPDTKDNVFLLNIDEAIKYFGKSQPVTEKPEWFWNESRRGIPTDYLVDRGMVYDGYHHSLTPWDGYAWLKEPISYLAGSVGWWLRNIGSNPICMVWNASVYDSQPAKVTKLGTIDAAGTSTVELCVGVRPAILIDVPS